MADGILMTGDIPANIPAPASLPSNATDADKAIFYAQLMKWTRAQAWVQQYGSVPYVRPCQVGGDPWCVAPG